MVIISTLSTIIAMISGLWFIISSVILEAHIKKKFKGKDRLKYAKMRLSIGKDIISLNKDFSKDQKHNSLIWQLRISFSITFIAVLISILFQG